MTPAVAVTALLVLSAPPVWLSRSAELRSRWVTWLLIAAVAGPLLWWGPVPTAGLAAAVALVASREYARLLGMPRADAAVLAVAAVVLPAAALVRPDLLALLPVLLLLTPLVPVLTGDVAAGGTRAAHLAFGIVWLAWAPAHLVLVHDDALLVVLAVAVCDVASWAGGRALGRLPVLSTRFTPVSPNKTVAGLAGGAAGAGLLLAALGAWSPPLWLAVAVGAPVGDLVASLFKRQAGVKDAGRCLPGFGGVLDRVDSLLVVLPLVAVLR